MLHEGDPRGETASKPPRAGGIYVASRASLPERGAMWRRLRAEGWPIASSWIDESGEGETADFGELWARIAAEVAGASALVFYAEPGDLPLKGALVEAGMALAAGLEVYAVLPGVVLEPRSMRPVGSWLAHPAVRRMDRVEEALAHWAAGRSGTDSTGRTRAAFHPADLPGRLKTALVGARMNARHDALDALMGEAAAEGSPARAGASALAEAAWQVLDDMGEGFCASPAAKAQLRVAIEPWITPEMPLDAPFEEARRLLADPRADRAAPRGGGAT